MAAMGRVRGFASERIADARAIHKAVAVARAALPRAPLAPRLRTLPPLPRGYSARSGRLAAPRASLCSRSVCTSYASLYRPRISTRSCCKCRRQVAAAWAAMELGSLAAPLASLSATKQPRGHAADTLSHQANATTPQRRVRAASVVACGAASGSGSASEGVVHTRRSQPRARPMEGAALARWTAMAISEGLQ